MILITDYYLCCRVIKRCPHTIYAWTWCYSVFTIQTCTQWLCNEMTEGKKHFHLAWYKYWRMFQLYHDCFYLLITFYIKCWNMMHQIALSIINDYVKCLMWYWYYITWLVILWVFRCCIVLYFYAAFCYIYIVFFR